MESVCRPPPLRRVRNTDPTQAMDCLFASVNIIISDCVMAELEVRWLSPFTSSFANHSLETRPTLPCCLDE